MNRVTPRRCWWFEHEHNKEHLSESLWLWKPLSSVGISAKGEAVQKRSHVLFGQSGNKFDRHSKSFNLRDVSGGEIQPVFCLRTEKAACHGVAVSWSGCAMGDLPSIIPPDWKTVHRRFLRLLDWKGGFTRRRISFNTGCGRRNASRNVTIIWSWI